MLDAFNLSSFGALHTLIALVAVACGIVTLARHGRIGTDTRPGRAYVVLTVATAGTGLFIFRHGGFGAPHALSILTLLVLAFAYAAERKSRSFHVLRYVSVLGYSLTLLFHLIPGLTEGGTRIPLGDPAFSGPEDPVLKLLVGIGFVLYLLGAAWQALRLHRQAVAPRAVPAR